MTAPNLLWGDKPTEALDILRWCSEEHGFREPWSHKHSFRISRQRNLLYRMSYVGWIEKRKSGPRGGEFYHATEKGRALIDAANQPPEIFKPLFILLTK